MKRNKFFALIFTLAFLSVMFVACDCGCGIDMETKELEPYEAVKYLLTTDGITREVKVFKYNDNGQTITLKVYGADNTEMSMDYLEPEQSKKEDESNSYKGTYFDF